MSDIKRNSSRCYCINLRRTSGVVTDYYNAMLKPCGLTLNQFSLLSSIEKIRLCSVSDLAHAVGLERTTLARNLKHLFNDGYIEDVAPAGTRSRQLKITEKGSSTLSAGLPLWEKAQRGIQERLGEEAIDQLTAMLSVLEHI